MSAGRPRIIETPEEFEQRASAFFAQCASEGSPITITGLALALGFADRQSLYDYQARSEFSGTVKWARLVVEHDYEMRLVTKARPTGEIFAMKNMGWSDRQSIEVDHKGGVMIVPAEAADAERWAREVEAEQRDLARSADAKVDELLPRLGDAGE